MKQKYGLTHPKTGSMPVLGYLCSIAKDLLPETLDRRATTVSRSQSGRVRRLASLISTVGKSDVFGKRFKLSFLPLRSASCFLQSKLLALNGAGVARQKSRAL